jgi:hypothetical protein
LSITSSKLISTVVPVTLAADSGTGAALSGVTVKVTTSLVTLLLALVATTRNRAPLSLRKTAAMV